MKWSKIDQEIHKNGYNFGLKIANFLYRLGDSPARPIASGGF